MKNRIIKRTKMWKKKWRIDYSSVNDGTYMRAGQQENNNEEIEYNNTRNTRMIRIEQMNNDR